jgi:hypothetical protein
MKIKIIWAMVLMVHNAAAQIKVDAQPKKSIVHTVKKWQYTIGVYASMDAEAIYITPTIKASIAYQIRPKLLVEGYGHYFKAKVDNNIEKGSLLLTTAGIKPIFLLGKNNKKGMYVGIGIAVQHRVEAYTDMALVIDDTRTNILPSYYIGYKIPTAKNNAQLAIELFGTGPYNETNTNGRYIEILTQLSLGVKVIF